MSNKEDHVVIQAVLVADNFSDEFIPITNDIPLALLPVANTPLIDYSLEFLSFGGVEETFIFCSSNVDAIRRHVNTRIQMQKGWPQKMKVNIIVSESCRSFGDCLRDLDAKGLLRGSFVLIEAGVVANIKLSPIIKKHNDIMKKDKGAAMTLIYKEASNDYLGYLNEELLIASNANNRILFHKKLQGRDRKIDFPLDLFIENSSVSIRHNIKDTHIAICSSSVLPLFTDNFDFQTRDDFIKGLLINEEILGSTIYWHCIKGNQYGGAVTNWRNFQNISHELINLWVYPIVPNVRKYNASGERVVVGANYSISQTAKIAHSVIGNNVIIGENVNIENSFIFDDVTIADNSVITYSVIGNKCILQNNCKVTAGSVLGSGVKLNKESFVENSVVQSTKPADYDAKDKLGDQAFRLKLHAGESNSDIADRQLSRKLSRLHIGDEFIESDDDSGHLSESDGDLSYTNSPVPDDTNMFFTEVIDSLTRGFEDKLQCDNLILEINSSRYAYNITLKEVTFNVVRAILSLPFQNTGGQQYLHSLRQFLVYFSPILKNYIRNESSMIDSLQAIEEIATTSNELQECIVTVLNWFYDKDYFSEDGIVRWFGTLNKNTRLFTKVKPFVDWLQEAEEASSSEESS